jgi:hypothetical protein
VVSRYLDTTLVLRSQAVVAKLGLVWHLCQRLGIADEPFVILPTRSTQESVPLAVECNRHRIIAEYDLVVDP